MQRQFQVYQQNGDLRCGVLNTNHGSIKTPTVLPYAKRGTVSPLTPAELIEVGCQGMAVDLLPFIVHPGVEAIQAAGSLHQFLQWSRPLISLVADLPDMIKVKKNAVELGVRYVEPYTKANKRLTGQQAWQLQRLGQADMAVPLFQNANYYAPVDDLKLATELNLNWQSQAKSDWGVVSGAGLRSLRQCFIQELGPKDGYFITNLPKEPTEWRRIVREVVSLLPSGAVRMLIAKDDWQVMAAIQLGIDVILTASPIERAHRGDTFVGDQVLHVGHERYRDDQRLLSLPNGEAMTFAYLHYLNHLQDQVADHFLGLNNLWWINQFTAEIQKMITSGDTQRINERCQQCLNNPHSDN